MTLKIKPGVSVSDSAYPWMPLDSCPRGSKVNLFTIGGIALQGKYTGKEDWVLAWAPLPTTPPWLKELLCERYKGKQ